MVEEFALAIYRAAGSPPVPGMMDWDEWRNSSSKNKPIGPPVGECYLTGLPIERVGIPVSVAVKKTFTDHAWAACPDSSWVSLAAAFTMMEKAAIPGMDKPGAMRQFTHAVIGKVWRVYTLKQKREIAQILLAPPSERWGMSICASPMSAPHTLYRTLMNEVGKEWEIIFDGLSIRASAQKLREAMAVTEELYKFHTKNAIKTGNYFPKSILQHGEAAWLELEARVSAYRGMPILDLALFLSQKEDDKNEEA